MIQEHELMDNYKNLIMCYGLVYKEELFKSDFKTSSVGLTHRIAWRRIGAAVEKIL